jgi:hypothetical protein
MRIWPPKPDVLTPACTCDWNCSQKAAPREWQLYASRATVAKFGLVKILRNIGSSILSLV